MDLLEREQFIAELDATLDQIAAGGGRMVLVSGEAGIGKTSLVERFTEKHKTDVRLLWGACDALFTPRPLGPFHDIAYEARSNLLSLLEEEAPRASILSAVFDEIDAGPSPTITVIEDIHWADEATLDVLKFLGRRINRSRAMLLLTYRDDEVGPSHPLRVLLGDLPYRSVTRIRLPPLSEMAVEQLAARANRRIEDLYPVTGGNPFFVTEALASAESGVPVTISDAVLSRATRLSPASRDLLELVSVVPTKAEMWLINETSRPGNALIEECAGSGTLRSDGHTLSFRHELARRATEESIPSVRRQSLHGLVLKTLLQHKSDALLARIVHHAAQAGDKDVVIEYAPAAATQAAALNAHREAASHYATALQYAGDLEPKEQAHLHQCCSYELYLSGQVPEALAARREALSRCDELEDDLRRGDNLRWMSRLSWGVGQREAAERYGREAVDVLERLPPSHELAMAYSNQAQLHMLAQAHEEVVLWGSRAIELAQTLGATQTLAHALNNVGMAQLFNYNEEGRSKVEESLQLALTNHLLDDAARAYTNLSYIAVKNREYDLAARYLEDGIAYTTAHDLFYGLYMIAFRARMHFEQGDWDGAGDGASSVLGRDQLPAMTKIAALAVLGHLRVRRGDPDAMSLLDEARDLAIQTGELQRIAPVASARAEFAWLNNDLEQVKTEATSVLALAEVHNDPSVQEEFAFWSWRAGVATKTPRTARTPFVLQMAGDWRGAADAWSKLGCPYEEAMALADGDEPAQLLALQILERLGAGPAVDRVRQALRAAGARGIPRGPRPSTKENPAGLTNRQLEVLSLMAGGLSNPEIAGRLFVSVRTVDHHVAAILAKLDAHTRSEAVSLALKTHIISK